MSIQTSVDSKPLKFSLSPIDHLSLRTHFPKLIYFSTPEDDPSTIISVFRNGLAKTLEALPIFAGSLHLDLDASQPGTLAVQAPFLSADQILRTADLRDQYDLATLETKHFPPDGVDLALVWPNTPDSPPPVLMAQVSVIRGGAILYVGIHHCATDEIGMVNLLRVWSTYCRGEDGAALVKETWFDRQNLKHGAGTGNPQDFLHYDIAPEGPLDPSFIDRVTLFVPSPTVQCAILFFSDSCLEKLKLLVLESVQQSVPDAPKWISTNDALCAFMWSSFSAARLAVEPKPPKDFVCTFRMTMNARSRLSPPMSEEYCGNVVALVTPKAPIASVASCSLQPTAELATAALTIRAAYNTVNNTVLRDLIQMVNNLPSLHLAKPVFKNGYDSHHANLQTTSWARQPYYSMNWGPLLGTHIRRFRGRNLQTDGPTAIFPHIPAGGLEVLVGLERSHLRWLKGNEAFARFVGWRCVTGRALEEEGEGMGEGNGEEEEEEGAGS